MENKERKPNHFILNIGAGVGMIVIALMVLIIWIIQLARDGDPIGTWILLYFGLLFLILCIALSVAIIIGGIRKKRGHDDYNDAIHALNTQAQNYVNLTKVVTKHGDDLILSTSGSFYGQHYPTLPPGRMRGPGNMIIDRDALENWQD